MEVTVTGSCCKNRCCCCCCCRNPFLISFWLVGDVINTPPPAWAQWELVDLVLLLAVDVVALVVVSVSVQFNNVFFSML